jgi:two-component system LytT family sensor kinase
MVRKHIYWWVGMYFFWLMIFQKRSFALSTTATIEFCYLVFIAANYYFNIYFVVPRYLYKQKYLAFILLFGAGIMIAAFARVPLAALLNASYFFPGQPQPTLSAIFIASLLNIFIWTALLTAGKIAIDRYHFQRRLENVEIEKAKAELDFLNAQLNPHFLFNSLNSIYGQIDKHNTTARNMVLTFSEMLRYQLYECNKTSIDIGEEINYLRNYVRLQQVRKNDTLTVNFQVDESVKNFFVAPLLFIAFVENAFKHVGNNKNSSKIDITFRADKNVLQFCCVNSKENNSRPDDAHKGIGVENAKRRLVLHYGESHVLKIINEDSFYRVDLNLQLS